ncbi:MAG: hypothetical protein JNM32_11830 [Dechloromonas sp.]|nr:hypothetical protein [Dechloromonas sp.]
MKRVLCETSAALACVLMLAGNSTAIAAEPTVVELTQVACQFLESEQGRNHGFKSSNIKDCQAINARSATERLATATPLKLKPGKHIFRVTNKDVPYELGFWLRPASLVKRVSLPSVSGGGLTTGKTQDYVIDLKAGEYLYSCPLNTTPDYKLVVK